MEGGYDGGRWVRLAQGYCRMADFGINGAEPSISATRGIAG
jgi:hypothetical protein